jgi:hypothetical protein
MLENKNRLALLWRLQRRRYRAIDASTAASSRCVCISIDIDIAARGGTIRAQAPNTADEICRRHLFQAEFSICRVPRLLRRNVVCFVRFRFGKMKNSNHPVQCKTLYPILNRQVETTAPTTPSEPTKLPTTVVSNEQKPIFVSPSQRYCYPYRCCGCCGSRSYNR